MHSILIWYYFIKSSKTKKMVISFIFVAVLGNLNGYYNSYINLQTYLASKERTRSFTNWNYLVYACGSYFCIFKISFVFLSLQGLLFIFISLLLPLAKCHPPLVWFWRVLKWWMTSYWMHPQAPCDVFVIDVKS